MNSWIYRIIGKTVVITTKNTDFAEKKSKLGYIIYCKKETKKYRYFHN